MAQCNACLLSGMTGMLRRTARRILGLTWEEPCSREAHTQMYRGFYGKEPPPGWFLSDPLSTTTPPAGWVPPPLPPFDPFG